MKVPTRSVRRRVSLLTLCTVLAVVLASPVVLAGGSGETEDPEGQCSGVKQCLSQGDYGITLRYRFENVSDDDPQFLGNDGNASTLRTTLFYRSAELAGFFVMGEFEDVSDIGLQDQHNNAGAGDLANGVTDRPGIADPNVTEVNQFYVGYRVGDAVSLQFGRQEIALGEQRLVGTVGWRQNHQSFDGLRVDSKALPRTSLSYAYLDNVNRIFGDDKSLEGHAFEAGVQVCKSANVAPYYLRLDYDAMADAGLSTQTLGLRIRGKAELQDGWSIPYHLELAQQDDVGDNPSNVDAGYTRVEVGAGWKRYGITLGYELLEGQPGDGSFATPLATLHKFNGWADKFLNTPGSGLEDTYLALRGQWNEWSASVIYHDFAPDAQGGDYGSEVDAVVTWKAPWKQSFGLTAALYDADNFSNDTEKIWLWTSYAF